MLCDIDQLIATQFAKLFSAERPKLSEIPIITWNSRSLWPNVCSCPHQGRRPSSRGWHPPRSRTPSQHKKTKQERAETHLERQSSQQFCLQRPDQPSPQPTRFLNLSPSLALTFNCFHHKTLSWLFPIVSVDYEAGAHLSRSLISAVSNYQNIFLETGSCLIFKK